MPSWRYDITSYSVEDVQQLVAQQEHQAGPFAPSLMYCDKEGTCFFDQMPNRYVNVIVDILNGRGREGWELVNVAFRERQMICVWKRPLEEAD
jgi:hypothetical protein